MASNVGKDGLSDGDFAFGLARRYWDVYHDDMSNGLRMGSPAL